MKITGLTVEGAGRFRTPVTVSGFGDGVNVLCEHNEAGKSTLFKALRTCLFERHSTGQSAVKSLASSNAALPLAVTLDFEHDGHAYTVKKSFLRSASASLKRDGVEIARNSEADELLWETLGIKPGSGRSIDQAAFGLLWVEQGKSFDLPDPTEAAKGALNAAIQAEVGALVGGERARALLADLRADLAGLVTATGKAKAGGPLATAEANVADLDGRLSEVRGRMAAVDAQTTQLTDKRAERARLGDAAILAELETDAATAAQDAAAARDAHMRLALQEGAAKSVQRDAETARKAAADVAERAECIDRDRARDEAIATSLAGLDADAAGAAERLRAAIDAIAALKGAEDEHDVALRRLKLLRQAAADRTGREALVQRRTALTEFRDALRKADAELALNPVTDDALGRLDTLERERDTLLARLEAGAARVSIDVRPAGSGRVSVNGAAADSGASMPVTAPLRITVGDLADITIVPPRALGAAEEKRRAEIDDEIARLLATSGAASAADLRVRRELRRRIESERGAVLAGLKALGVAANRLPDEIDALSRQLALAEETAAKALAETGRDDLPGIADIEREQSEVEERQRQARIEHARLDSRKDAENARLQTLARARGPLEGERAELGRRLAADLALLPDADRARLSADATEAADRASALARLEAERLDEQRRLTPDAGEIERLNTRAQRLRDAVAQRKTALADLDNAMAKLEGQIQAAGAEGLGERQAALQDELEYWRRDAARHQQRVHTLQLLHDTIATSLDAERERLNAPIKRHLQPFLLDVFAAADVNLDDNFGVSGLRRAGPAHEAFDLLSDGTKEQIAVLTRLAMGALLAERGQHVPIVLDDALVFSDDDRIERMFDALGRAAQRQQVIVFTCRTRAFARLGGRKLSLT